MPLRGLLAALIRTTSGRGHRSSSVTAAARACSSTHRPNCESNASPTASIWSMRSCSRTPMPTTSWGWTTPGGSMRCATGRWMSGRMMKRSRTCTNASDMHSQQPDPSQRLFRPHLIRRNIDRTVRDRRRALDAGAAAARRYAGAGISRRESRVLHGCQFDSRAIVRSAARASMCWCSMHCNTRSIRHISPSKKRSKRPSESAQEQTLFTHIAHALGHEQTNAQLPAGMRLAFDGQRVTGGVAMNRYTSIAEYYDAENERLEMLRRDVPLFLKHIPKRRRMTVLELACGTARAAIPIAQAGHTVVGVERDPAMLAIAKRKARCRRPEGAELKLVRGDALNIKLGRTIRPRLHLLQHASCVHDARAARIDCSPTCDGISSARADSGSTYSIPITPCSPSDIAASSNLTSFYVPEFDRTVAMNADVERDMSRQWMRVTFNYRWFDHRGRERRQHAAFEMTAIFRANCNYCWSATAS